MTIHQIQIRPDEREDRLLMRVSTTDGCEYRFWLTRRFVKLLWGLLLRMAAWDKTVGQQLDPATRQSVLEIQHEGHAQQGDFSKNYEESTRSLPLEQATILLCSAKGVRRDNGLQVLSLYPPHGQGIDMTLDARLLQIFARLVRDAAARAGWDLNLDLHGRPVQPDQPEALPARKLN